MANEQEIGKLVIRLIAEVKDLKKGLGEAQKEIKGFSDQSKKTTDSFTSSIAGIQTAYLAAAAKIYIAYKVIQQAMAFLEIGAKAQQVEESFASLTKSMGVNGEELIRQMKEVGVVFVDQTGLMIKAQRLLVEGVDPKDIVKLMESARVAARLMGTDVGEAFDRISEAVITLRTRGLKAAFSMDDQKVVEKYAESLGTIPKYLEKVGERQAIVNEILRQTVEKKSFLGTMLNPTTAENLEKTRSAFAEMKESVSKLVVEFVLASDALPILMKIIKTISDGVVEFSKFKDEFGVIFAAIGVGLNTVLVGVSAVFVGATAIFAGIMELNYELLALMNFLTLNAFPALGKAVEDFGKRRDKVFESLEKQATALNKLVFEPPKEKIAAKEVAKPLGEVAKKEQKDLKKIQEDLTKFRLANEEQRIVAEANIHRLGLQMKRTQEITALKKLGEDTVMLELEWDKRIAQADYNATMKSLDVKRRAEVDAAILAKMDVADVKKKFGVLEKEAAEKLAAELGEIEAKKALSFEGMTGLTEQELQKRTEYSRALREGDLDDAMRANKVQEALEARLSDQIVKNKMAEDQLSITKEDRLRKEIDLSTELLGYAQERLNVLSEEDDAWVSASGEVENYKNKIKELNYELDRQTATFEQLAVSGLKKYSIALKEDLIDNMENFVPRAIDSAGGAFKTFLKDVSSGTKSLSESFKDMAKSFGESIMDMIIDIGLLIIKMEILKALKIDQPAAGAGAGTSGGGYGWIGSILSLIVGLFQAGGTIRGPSGRDKVLLRGTAGEFMQPVPTVKYYGEDVMEKLRRREIPREALLSLSSGIPQGSRVRPSFMMEAGGTVPLLSGDRGEEKKTEITLINVIDQREMDSWAASARGQNAIINVISSRAETVRKVLQ